MTPQGNNIPFMSRKNGTTATATLLGTAVTILLMLAVSADAASSPFRLATGHRDVCVLGGGAAGMAAAVFAKDRGHSVVVIESADRVGGQCDTIDFAAPAPGMPSWIDIGVQFFANTTAANEVGLGPWTIDSVGIVQRFAGPGSVYPLDFTTDTTPNYAVNLLQGVSYGFQPPAPPTPEFLAAYYRLSVIIASYPWIDRAEVPSPVPAELLVPFSQFIATHDLGPLVPSLFVPQLSGGGLGAFDKLTTLYALLNLSPTISRIFSVPYAGFVVAGGCRGIYDGMRAYLTADDADNVLVNAKTLIAVRPYSPRLPVIVGGTLSTPDNGNGLAGSFTYVCGKLIVAYAQTEQNMKPLALDVAERRLFKEVRQRYYFTGTIDAAGPVVDGGAFNMLNIDPTSPFGTPALPAVTQITRGLPYGPVQFKATSQEPISVAAMRQLVVEQLARMPASLLTNATAVDEFLLHAFQPHFTDAELARPGGAYAALEALQGHRKTYYVGALKNFAVTYQLWQARTTSSPTASRPFQARSLSFF
ncbi:thioredoxin reductase [Pandoravirus inopinatum]|uniref:Thioredoxin reductase n=1 Tax=Pandoravirus inopinatum TaxID=1605721 RepID=A0A0B5J073_9VIRU|nr:thioredoxin reductase [Pandoravirus inopinatum]AJF96839.1 thioredoxin reductase [Pandoravirus inopinatum]